MSLKSSQDFCYVRLFFSPQIIMLIFCSVPMEEVVLGWGEYVLDAPRLSAHSVKAHMRR